MRSKSVWERSGSLETKVSILSFCWRTGPRGPAHHLNYSSTIFVTVGGGDHVALKPHYSPTTSGGDVTKRKSPPLNTPVIWDNDSLDLYNTHKHLQFPLNLTWNHWLILTPEVNRGDNPSHSSPLQVLSGYPHPAESWFQHWRRLWELQASFV